MAQLSLPVQQYQLDQESQGVPGFLEGLLYQVALEFQVDQFSPLVQQFLEALMFLVVLGCLVGQQYLLYP